jgi:threonine dehydrogenase-like Zn-dependent dehydrogenase
MRAARLRAGQFEIHEMAAPAPLEGQALVRTMTCGICGSDLHRFHASAAAADSGAHHDSLVLGHEFCGELLEYGPSTHRGIRPGKLVVSFPCIMGPQALEVIGFSERFGGGFGEQMLVQSDFMLEVPNGLSAEHAALTEPMAVGEHAVGCSDIAPGDVAMVVGCGPVGLAVIAALRMRSIGPIVAVDFSPERRAIAEKLGVDRTVDPALTSPYSCWEDFGIQPAAQMMMFAHATREKLRRAVIFECVGAPGLLGSAISGAPIGATIVVAGACASPETIVPLSALVKEVQVRFSSAYTRDEFSATLENIANGRLDISNLITKSVGLDGIQDAFDALSRPVDAKIILQHRR